MTRPTPMAQATRPLRLVEDGDLPAPLVDDLSAHVMAEAIDALAALRTYAWLGDSRVHLHALTSLIAQAQQMLPDADADADADAVADARDQDYTWAEIGQLLNQHPDTAARRYRHTKPRST